MGLKPLLTKDFATENLEQLKVYERTGGYTGFKKALEMQPDELVELVKKSGLRGRGGAGFPTGNKWSFLPKGVFPRYLVCNADESEPGCFKDRYLIEESPHQVLEGILIASYAIGCNLAFIYIRGEYLPQTEALERAIEEARQAGYLGKNVLGKGYDIDVILHRGAGAYICGEETAMLTSLEGSAASRASSRRSRRSRASTVSRPWSTTSRPSATSRISCSTAPTGSRRSVRQPGPGHGCGA